MFRGIPERVDYPAAPFAPNILSEVFRQNQNASFLSVVKWPETLACSMRPMLPSLRTCSMRALRCAHRTPPARRVPPMTCGHAVPVPPLLPPPDGQTHASFVPTRLLYMELMQGEFASRRQGYCGCRSPVHCHQHAAQVPAPACG